MQRTWHSILIALFVLGTFSVASASAPHSESNADPRVKATPVRPELMGMVIRDPWYDFNTHPAYPNQPNYTFQDTMGATLAAAGVRWIRLDIHIFGDNVEQEIAKNDYFIQQVAPRHGFKLLVLLNFDLLKGTDPRKLNDKTYIPSRFGGGVNAYMETWLNRALAVADRYPGQIDAFEILNEQNRLPQIAPKGPAGDAIDPRVVGRLIAKFYRFCKGIDVPAGEPQHGCANAKIILGGLHPRGTSDAKGKIVLTDAEYLRAIYTDPDSFAGFKKQRGFYPVDGIGYHPYPEEIRQSMTTRDVLVDRGLGRIRDALISVQDPCIPLWITEIGYNIGFDPDGVKGKLPKQTEVGQMSLMQDVYTTLNQRQVCGGPEMHTVFWFKYEDFPPASGPDAQQWGIVRIPFTEGPQCPGGACYDVHGTPAEYRGSYLAYRELAGIPNQYVFLPTIGR
jgi:hypothetical protein